MASDFEGDTGVLTAEAVKRLYGGRPTRMCHEVEELVTSHEALRAERDVLRLVQVAVEATPKQWSTARAPTLEAIAETARRLQAEADRDRLAAALEGVAAVLSGPAADEAEEAAKALLRSLVGEETTLGTLGRYDPHRDPNRWTPRHTKGQAHSLIVAFLAAYRRRAAAAERAACASLAACHRLELPDGASPLTTPERMALELQARQIAQAIEARP